MATMPEEIRSLVEQLSPANQQRVLEFAQDLKQATTSLPKSKPPPGTPGSLLLRFSLPLEDAEEMERALEDCEALL
jgi:hypothetical protein